MMKKNLILPFTVFAILFGSLQVNAQGFLHASGKYIYNGNNQEVILRGIGTGNWFLMEGYMMKTADFAGTHTQFRELLTETIGEQNTELFYESWLNNHFTRQDVDSMKAWGFNSVRVAMHYKWFTLPIEQESVAGQDTWLEDGFIRIDSLLDWCGDQQMYLILDMHGAPGGQGHDRPISDYDPDYPSLWESAENRRKLTALWRKLADRYADEPWMGGYDLINEPNWDLPGGTLLKQTYVSIIQAIREVDPDHMIIIEGNWFANDYTGLTPPWDDNMVYSFHKYWNYNTQESIQWMINIRNTYNVPIWLGETGENSNSWFTDLVALAEQNKIGWSWWPVKKNGINNVLMVPESQAYEDLLSYWQYGSPSVTPTQAYYAVLDWADNHSIASCTVQRDVIDALIRQPHSNATLPFRTYQISEPVNLVNYDLGKCSYAYWDKDTANYRLNTNVFTSWNEGWSYRNDGVDIEKCLDNFPGSNGFHVGWTNDNEWLQFTVTSDSAAAYQVLVRSAAASNPGAVHLLVNGTDVSPVHALPETGGWQIWQSSTVENVIIPAGTNKIRLYFDKGGSNVSLIQFLNPIPVSAVAFQFTSAVTSADGLNVIVTLNKPVTSFTAQGDDFKVEVNSVQAEISNAILNPGNNRQIIITLAEAVKFTQTITLSYSGNEVMSESQALEIFTEKPVKNMMPQRFVLPVKIQAEDYDFNNGFQLETCTDVGGGQNVGFANNGDYLDYNITVPYAGEYTFRFRVASQYSNGSISVRLGDGNEFSAIKTISFAGTGGWQSWTSQEYKVNLPEGDYTLRLYSVSGEYNINWFEISAPTEINEVPQLRNFRVYPNPGNGRFHIEAEFDAITNVSFTFFDLYGNKMCNYHIGNTLSVNTQVDDLVSRPGIYFLNFSTETGSLTRKLIVN
jgi:hypothetical protein